MKIGEIWKPRKQAQNLTQALIDKFTVDYPDMNARMTKTNKSNVKIVSFYDLDDGSEIVGFIDITDGEDIHSYERKSFLEHYEKVHE
jgi:hypothetical protein